MAKKTQIAGRFTIERKISYRGIREQYLGFDNSNNLPVIIETLDDSLQNDLESKTAIASEMALAKKLNGPYFANFIGSFNQDKKDFYIFDYVDGESLSDCSSLDSLSLRDVCSFISKTVKAISLAHSKGIIHGALSSDSILITPANSPVIVGFSSNWVEPITDPGMTNGVSQYACAAPELFEGASIDESCDLYAIGKIAEYMFKKNDLRRLKVEENQSIEIKRAKEIIVSLLSLDREHRYSAAQMLVDPDFLGSLSTPPQGNQSLVLSKSELRRIKKNLKKGKQSFREPLNDQTQIMIAVGIKIASILAIGLIAILIIVKFM